MSRKLNPQALLARLVAQGTDARLSEVDIATIFSLVEGEGTIVARNSVATQSLADKDTIAQLTAQLADAQQAREIANTRAAAAEGALHEVLHSTSWRAAAPLRAVKNTLRARRDRVTDNRPQPAKNHADTAPKPSRFGTTQTIETQADGAQAETTPIMIIPPHYTAPTNKTLPKTLPASLYAFYLPQFHPIAENDAWWGEGFTEWTNVRPAKPSFKGHYQPHEPHKDMPLGYYDLRNKNVMAEQMKLARRYGVEGFCFYFYWFAGHRLLETPLLNLLDDPDLDVPFFLCWANENWSRRWDGRDSEVLMAQDHSAADDLAFIQYISKYMTDPRYRRIDGKPVLMVYRPSDLPDAKASAGRWRGWCRDNGVGEIYITYAQSFELRDPRDYSFDAAVEFPPNYSDPPNVTHRVEPLSEPFEATVFDWDIFPTRSDTYARPEYPLYRSVCPAWDNTARRKGNGTVFINSTPARYEHWLRNAIIDTARNVETPNDRIVFINAWNEWAEGAHLEPDNAYGYGYLEATRDALLSLDGDKLEQAVASKIATEKAAKKCPDRIVIVTHDAHPMGAQMLSMNLVKTLRDDYGIETEFVTLGDGPIMEQYRRIDNFHDLSGHAPHSDHACALAEDLRSRADIAICNTTVSGLYGAILKKAGFTVVSLIHELPDIIRRYNLEQHADAVAAHADHIVFPADLVKTSFEGFTGPLHDKAVICPQGAYKRNRFSDQNAREAAARDLREQLNLSPTCRIVLGVGYADHRKGYDVFIDAAERLAGVHEHIVFVWIGHFDPELERRLKPRTDALIAAENLVLPGRVSDTDIYYAGADVYLLTSREDPYPSTVLEALDVGLLTVGFEGATGSVALIAQHKGIIVPPFDMDALCAAVKRALITGGPAMRSEIAEQFHARDDVSFSGYVGRLLALAGREDVRVERKTPTITAVVPNYNYARFLPDRINSITRQTVSVNEIVLLDDCSTDDSRAVMDTLEQTLDIPVTRIDNDTNSGSVFAQWLRGVEAASGEYVWIAEADDLAHPAFLEAVMAGFKQDGVVMSYAQSQQINQSGMVMDDNYLTYVSDVDTAQWRDDYTRTGKAEITRGLSVKNTIPNVSAVVFHRETLLSVLRNHMAHIQTFRVAGDWAAYIHMLECGDIAYVRTPLNQHRRHDNSVTIAKFGEAELAEIQTLQDYVAANFDIEADMTAKAKAYIKTLRAQFGLEK